MAETVQVDGRRDMTFVPARTLEDVLKVALSGVATRTPLAPE